MISDCDELALDAPLPLLALQGGQEIASQVRRIFGQMADAFRMPAVGIKLSGRSWPVASSGG